MRRVVEALRVRWADARADESGIALVFVALTLVVLIGMTAFAIDISALYQERRELQNGADAGAIAIAEDCALGAQPCTHTVAMTTAAAFADANAGDVRAAVDTVVLDTVAQTIDVAVSTETAAGGTIFRPFFAQVVGFSGATVHANAAAAWGYPSGLETIPLIISECEWERETNYGVDLHEGDPPYTGTPTLLLFHTGGGNGNGNGAGVHDDCAAQAGQDTDGDGRMPGGFGWLDSPSDCISIVDENDWVDTDPGASPPHTCDAGEWESDILNHIVFIPWFDDLDGNGNNGEFHIAGFGAFYVTGYNFGGQYKAPNNNEPCTGQIRCLEGYFVKKTITEGDIGGTDHGLLVVKFTK